jgi:hypothetical protein
MVPANFFLRLHIWLCEVLRSLRSLTNKTSQTSPNFTNGLRSEIPRGYKEKHYTSPLHTTSYTPLYFYQHLPSFGRTWNKTAGVKDPCEVVKFGQKRLVIAHRPKIGFNFMFQSGHGFVMRTRAIMPLTTRYCTVSGLKTWHIHRLFGGIANSVLTALRLEDRVTSSMIHPPAALRDSYQGQNDTSVTGLGLAQPMAHKPSNSLVRPQADPRSLILRVALHVSNSTDNF